MRHLPVTPHHELPWPIVLMAFVLTLTAVAHAHPERLRPLVTHLHHTPATASLNLRQPLATPKLWRKGPFAPAAYLRSASAHTRDKRSSHRSDLQG